jgi:hypothetical protein
LKFPLKFGSRSKTFLVDQNQFICLPKVVDQNRIFSLPKTFLFDQKSCAISVCKNIKIYVDIAMRKGGIHSLGQLSNTISFLNEIGKV